ncbi:hypothetical protein JX266_012780 [Neoarthrinium moseri]|nr:hypothetical protein JX266_012780 [Neoarthrinium moseri]
MFIDMRIRPLFDGFVVIHGSLGPSMQPGARIWDEPYPFDVAYPRVPGSGPADPVPEPATTRVGCTFAFHLKIRSPTTPFFAALSKLPGMAPSKKVDSSRGRAGREKLEQQPMEDSTSRRRKTQTHPKNTHPSPARKVTHGTIAPNSRTGRIIRRENDHEVLQRRKSFLRLTLGFGVIFFLAFNSAESNILHHLVFPSYKLEGDSGAPQYGKGPWDIVFVGFYTALLCFLRELAMQELLLPLARRCGIRQRGKQMRFMEQMHAALYTAFVGPFGLYCMSKTPVWYFNTRGMYESYPHQTHEASVKFYYLFQAAFWAHQVVVMLLGVEKRRKDFKELVIHHIVTVGLISLSYRFHFTYIGIAVYVTHDISDFFLAILKSLNYAQSSLQGVSFAICVLVWTYTRHHINLRILYSLVTEFRTVGPYELNWGLEQFKCPLALAIAFTLLAVLQALNLFWLYCLMRSAYRFVFRGIAKDDRSEDEEPTPEVLIADGRAL